MIKYSLSLLTLIGLAGCGAMSSSGLLVSDPTTQSVGELESGYTYIPIDPFSVQIADGANCKDRQNWIPGQLLDTLPDNAVRMLVERFDISGSVAYGVSKSGSKGESYRVTVDYINADTINVPMRIEKAMLHRKTKELGKVPLVGPAADYEPGTEFYRVSRASKANAAAAEAFDVYNIPVYVGVGLRVSANVYVVGAKANISGIGVIGAEAEAEKLRGSLVVQTLGVNGKAIAAALPIQSELNRTTAQNAIVAVGSIKSLLYSEETVKSPRVVGLYLPFPGGKPLVNALISELSKERVEWERPCLAKPPKV